MTAYRVEHDPAICDDADSRWLVWWPVPYMRLIAATDTLHEASLAMEAHWQQVLDGTDDPTLDLSRPRRMDLPDPSLTQFHGLYKKGPSDG